MGQKGERDLSTFDHPEIPQEILQLITTRLSRQPPFFRGGPFLRRFSSLPPRPPNLCFRVVPGSPRVNFGLSLDDKSEDHHSHLTHWHELYFTATTPPPSFLLFERLCSESGVPSRGVVFPSTLECYECLCDAQSLRPRRLSAPSARRPGSSAPSAASAPASWRAPARPAQGAHKGQSVERQWVGRRKRRGRSGVRRKANIGMLGEFFQPPLELCKGCLHLQFGLEMRVKEMNAKWLHGAR